MQSNQTSETSSETATATAPNFSESKPNGSQPAGDDVQPIVKNGSGKPKTGEPKPKIRSLARALLGDEDNEDAGSSSTEESRETDETKPSKGGEKLPKGLHAVAERLGVKPDLLYEVEVPLADGSTTTLGKLKDFYGEREQVATRELELEERRIKHDADVARAKSELETLLKDLPENALKPETLKLIRERAAADREMERVRTLEAIPEWKDEAVRTRELKEIVEMLEGYGFTAAYLDRTLDSRVFRLARDSWLRKTRIDKALAEVRKVDTTPTGKSGKTPQGKASSSPNLSRRQMNARTLLGELD